MVALLGYHLLSKSSLFKRFMFVKILIGYDSFSMSPFLFFKIISTKSVNPMFCKLKRIQFKSIFIAKQDARPDNTVEMVIGKKGFQSTVLELDRSSCTKTRSKM